MNVHGTLLTRNTKSENKSINGIICSHLPLYRNRRENKLNKLFSFSPHNSPRTIMFEKRSHVALQISFSWERTSSPWSLRAASSAALSIPRPIPNLGCRSGGKKHGVAPLRTRACTADLCASRGRITTLLRWRGGAARSPESLLTPPFACGELLPAGCWCVEL